MQLALGPALNALKGRAAPEVEQTYARARVLCAQIGETPQRFAALWSLCQFYLGRGALLAAQEQGAQLFGLAQRAGDPTHRLEAHDVLGTPSATWATTPPPGRTSSRGSPSPTRRRSRP